MEKGRGYIPSEADIRLLGVRNFGNAPQIANNYWDTSTLSATKGKDVKVILPYETGSRELTDVAEFDLGLINPDEKLVNYGVNLDIKGRWKKQEGSGVYTRDRKDWFEKGDDTNLIGLNKDMKEDHAQKCPIIMTKFGHPNYVDKPFWRVKGERNQSIDEIHSLIHDTFELGKKENLVPISPLDESGKYKKAYGKFSLKKYSEVSKSDRKSTRLNSSHTDISRMPSSA